MLTVDAHVHSFPAGSLPQAMHDATARRWAYGVWPHRDPADVRDRIEPGFTDPNGALLVADLDAAGVDRAAVMMLDHAIGYGQEARLPVRALLEHYAGLQERYPERLVCFAGVDPRRKDARELLRYALVDLGLAGLKLYPPNGYYPHDDVCWPLLQLCAELGRPVLVHTAMIEHPLQGFYANPLHLAAVQHRLPELRLVFGHSGYPLWSEEACLTVEGHEHSFLEVSQWSWLVASDPARLTRTLGRFRDVVGPHRVLFASDHVPGPRFSGTRSALPALVAFVRSLPQTAPEHGVSFTDDEVELMLGGNATRLLGPPA